MSSLVEAKLKHNRVVNKVVLPLPLLIVALGVAQSERPMISEVKHSANCTVFTLCFLLYFLHLESYTTLSMAGHIAPPLAMDAQRLAQALPNDLNTEYFVQMRPDYVEFMLTGCRPKSCQQNR